MRKKAGKVYVSTENPGPGRPVFSKAAVKQAATRAVRAAFEGMAFLDVMQIQGSDLTIASRGATVLTIPITEPFLGDMTLVIPRECRNRIVENIFGKDNSQIGSKTTGDCLLELLNVFAGTFMGDLLGPEARYKIGFPGVVSGGKLALGRGRSMLVYAAEGAVFAAAIHIR